MDVTPLTRDTDQVPRQTPRQPGPDDWAAQRIRYERERRGWSTAELARRVTAAGVPIRQQSVWQIESGEPRRKVSIGEASALCEVFGITLDELTRSQDAVITDEVVKIRDDLRAWKEDARSLLSRLLDVLKRFDQLRSDPEAFRGLAVYGHPAGMFVSDVWEQFREAEHLLADLRRSAAESLGTPFANDDQDGDISDGDVLDSSPTTPPAADINASGEEI